MIVMRWSPLIAHEPLVDGAFDRWVASLLSWTCFFALMVHCAVEPSAPLFLRQRNQGAIVGRRCCVVLDGTARTTMSIIALRSNVRAVSYLSAGNTHKLVARMKFS